jgi:AraC family transcriptional regulator, ethanolamine operon transcriptional activator
MTAPTPKSPTLTPHAAEFRISDFDHLARLFTRWDGQFAQLSCGRFEGILQVGRGQQLNAHLVRANQAIMVRGQEGPGVLTVTLVIPESAGCVWQGRRLDAGCLVVRGGDVEVDHRTTKHATNFMVSFTEAGLLRAARAITRTDAKPISWLAVRPSPDVFGRLEANLRQFLDAARSLSPDSHGALWFEHACLTAVAEAVFPMSDSRKNDLPRSARAGLVWRAEELMRSSLQMPMGECDLCAKLGVSGRTLRLAFRERFGLGPMAYFQTIRLHAARASLKSRAATNISIAKVAQNLGFFHLGKFAGYYRRQFGELPSATHLLS